jgi:4-amino-4-deoxy-L-arabinose transferase-like glycosyltransferase
MRNSAIRRMHFSSSGITSNAYIRSVWELVRKNARFFLFAGVAGLSLRLLFALRFPAVVDDSRLYADIAKNWLQHGIYGVTDSGQIAPTLSRLPGYPAFLAAVFAIFGPDNFRAVLLIQVLFDLGTCFLIADLARRLLSERASKAAFLLAALCPFLANYAAAALTETLEIFFTTVAMHLAICGLGIGNAAAPRMKFRSSSWLVSGLAVGAAILLRPDGGILLAAIGGYLLWLLVRGAASTLTRGATLRAGILLAVGAILPLVPWTVRNLRTLHRFEPLAPRYANDSDELVMKGFNRWTKTWIAEYVSVQEIYWNVPGETIDAARLPRRAFDSQQEKDQTRALFDDYNSEHEITPELDARFAGLAAARVQAAPLRYYFWLPALRITDMWLRPRTELLPSDPRWWEFNDDGRWLGVSLGFGIINLLYIALAAAGLVRAHGTFGIGLFITFLVLRSVFLGTLENPEPRYTLECYPAVILLASAFYSAIHRVE